MGAPSWDVFQPGGHQGREEHHVKHPDRHHNRKVAALGDVQLPQRRKQAKEGHGGDGGTDRGRPKRRDMRDDGLRDRPVDAPHKNNRQEQGEGSARGDVGLHQNDCNSTGERGVVQCARTDKSQNLDAALQHDRRSSVETSKLWNDFLDFVPVLLAQTFPYIIVTASRSDTTVRHVRGENKLQT